MARKYIDQSDMIIEGAGFPALVDDPEIFRKVASDRSRMLWGDIKPVKDHSMVHIVALGDGEIYGPNRRHDFFFRDVNRAKHGTFITHGSLFRNHVNRPDKKEGYVAKTAHDEETSRVELLVAARHDKCADWLSRIEKKEVVPFSMGWKCLFPKTKVPVKGKGLVQIENVEPGDLVACRNGWTKVVRKHENNLGNRLRVRLRICGTYRNLSVTEDHMIPVIRREQLRRTNGVMLRRHSFEITMVRAIDAKKKDYLVMPDIVTEWGYPITHDRRFSVGHAIPFTIGEYGFKAIPIKGKLVEKPKRTGNTVYCLEVEDESHEFAAAGVLVSNCAYDVCSECGHERPGGNSKYSCDHVKDKKDGGTMGLGTILENGRKIHVKNPSGYFDDISHVPRGADPTALFLRKVAQDPGYEPESMSEPPAQVDKMKIDTAEKLAAIERLAPLSGKLVLDHGAKTAADLSMNGLAGFSRVAMDHNLRVSFPDFCRIALADQYQVMENEVKTACDSLSTCWSDLVMDRDSLIKVCSNTRWDPDMRPSFDPDPSCVDSARKIASEMDSMSPQMAALRSSGFSNRAPGHAAKVLLNEWMSHRLSVLTAGGERVPSESEIRKSALS